MRLPSVGDRDTAFTCSQSTAGRTGTTAVGPPPGPGRVISPRTGPRLPDGSLVVLGYPERTVAINGVPTNYIGEQLVVLDQDFHVVWAWDAFDYLDVNRGPVLGESTRPGPGAGPTAVVPVLPAVDWRHVNAVSLSPTDGNLILPIRHQDWVIKIDYRNGPGAA